MEEKIIRGHQVIYERSEARKPVEHLRYTLDVYDTGGNLIEVLGSVADLAVAHAALRAACGKYPGKRIFLRERCRVIKRHDEL